MNADKRRWDSGSAFICVHRRFQAKNDLIIRRRRVVCTGRCVRAWRFIGRYVLAFLLIPLSVMVGLGGLMQYGWQRLRGRR